MSVFSKSAWPLNPLDEPVTSVEEALKLVDSFAGSPADFQLCIPDEFIDPVGWNMARITDRILARHWTPDGFSQAQGYRIYKYKAWEDVRE
jgi:hypothetical protein